MNRRLTEYGAFTINRCINGFYGGGSLAYDLECLICKCAVVQSYISKNELHKLWCERLSQVYAVTYIPLGVKGERYLAEKLKPFGETIESNNLKRLYCIIKSDHINEDNKKHFALGSKPLSEIDPNKEIENPDWTDVPGFVFRLNNVLLDLRRANLWNTKAFDNNDEVFNAVEDNFDNTGKLAVPEEILKIFNSPEYQAYQASELSDGEKAYLDNYFDKTDFLPPYPMDTDELLKLLKELANKDNKD